LSDSQKAHLKIIQLRIAVIVQKNSTTYVTYRNI